MLGALVLPALGASAVRLLRFLGNAVKFQTSSSAMSAARPKRAPFRFFSLVGAMELLLLLPQVLVLFFLGRSFSCLFPVPCCRCCCFAKGKERKRTKETVVGGVLDAIDRGHKLVRIPKKEI